MPVEDYNGALIEAVGTGCREIKCYLGSTAALMVVNVVSGGYKLPPHDEADETDEAIDERLVSGEVSDAVV